MLLVDVIVNRGERFLGIMMWLDWINIVREWFVSCDTIGSYGVMFLSKWEGIVDVVPRYKMHLRLYHGTLGLGILGVVLEVIVTIIIVVVEYMNFL